MALDFFEIMVLCVDSTLNRRLVNFSEMRVLNRGGDVVKPVQIWWGAWDEYGNLKINETNFWRWVKRTVIQVGYDYQSRVKMSEGSLIQVKDVCWIETYRMPHWDSRWSMMSPRFLESVDWRKCSRQESRWPVGGLEVSEANNTDLTSATQ